MARCPGQQHRSVDADRRGAVAPRRPAPRVDPRGAGPDRRHAPRRDLRRGRRCPRRHVRPAPFAHRRPGLHGSDRSRAHPADVRRSDAPGAPADLHLRARLGLGHLPAGVPVAHSRSGSPRPDCRRLDTWVDQRQPRSRGRTRDRRSADRPCRCRRGLRHQRRGISGIRDRGRRVASQDRDDEPAPGTLRLGPSRRWPLRALRAGGAAHAPAVRVLPGARQRDLGPPAARGDAASAHERERIRFAARCARGRRSRRFVCHPTAQGTNSRRICCCSHAALSMRR